MITAGARPGRNESCPCGSGRKYKLCCGAPRNAAARAAPATHQTEGLFAGALVRFRTDDLDGAQAACRVILRAAPDQVDALNLMGVIAWRREHYEWAESFFRRALRVRPDQAQFHMNLGGLYREQGKARESLEPLREALRLHPAYREARFNLALALSDLRRQEELEQCLADLLRAEAGPAGALALATELSAAGKHAEAAFVLAQALKTHPEDPGLLAGEASALAAQGDLAGAESSLRAALRIDAASAELLVELGKLMLRQQRFGDAEDHLRRALELDPRHRETHYQMARLMFLTRRLAEAEAHARRTVALAPESPEAHFILGETLLVQGRLEEGWGEYEWRWNEEPCATLKRSLPRPQWAGEELSGRTLLLHFEQGLGDTIHFARYAQVVAERACEVVLLCQPQLTRLLRSLEDGVRVVDDYNELPPHDFFCPLISLPRLLNTGLDTLPARVPYLRVPVEDMQRWSARFPPRTRPRVGLVWAGNPDYPSDAQRSIPWETIRPILRDSGIEWVSLQMLDRKASAAFVPEPGALIDVMDECRDLADTAAVIENLDLVIGVDTSVVHLAGALGRPVWLLSRFAGDWRWLMGRDDSPWYPTMRIFRQPSYGDWSPVLHDVGVALRQRSWRRMEEPTFRPEPRTGQGPHEAYRRQGGFTLIGLMFIVVVTMLALTGVATVWHTQAQREREVELLFIGDQYKRAIESYAKSSPGAPQLPEHLEDLLEDYRTGPLKRHLRRLYPDPMTGKVDWGLVQIGGRIAGVHSPSEGAPIKVAGEELAAFAGAERYSDWKFVAEGANQIAAARAGGVANGVVGTTGDDQQAQSAGPATTATSPSEPSPLVREACERTQRLETEGCKGRRGYPGVTKEAIDACLAVAGARYDLCLKGMGAAAPPLPVPEVQRTQQ